MAIAILSKRQALQGAYGFFRKYATRADITIILLIGTLFFLSFIFTQLNVIYFHFTHVGMFTEAFSASNALLDTILATFCLLMYFYGLYTKKTSPRGATFLWGTAGIILAFYGHIFLSNAIQTTPFEPIDKYLAAFDGWIGINTPALMSWIYQHHDLMNYFDNVYHSLLFQLVLIPFGLACFNARRALSVLLIALLSTFIIGTTIYYFFPTTAPSGVFHSPYFSLSQYHTSMRFYDVHHFIPVSIADGGLIAFPSFHVIWAILFTYSTKKIKWIFYPLLCVNIVLIISTVVLGWHYAADVIAGAIIAGLGIYLGEKLQEA